LIFIVVRFSGYVSIPALRLFELGILDDGLLRDGPQENVGVAFALVGDILVVLPDRVQTDQRPPRAPFADQLFETLLDDGPFYGRLNNGTNKNPE